MPILTDGDGTAIRIVGNQIFLDVDAVEATMIDSAGATSGHVLTADGSDGASWQAQTGGLAAADIDTLAELNAIVGDATLVDASHTHTASDVTDFQAESRGYVDAVSGGAGFTNVNGAVTLDLSTGRAFHHTMTGNITSLVFSNVPVADDYATTWSWALTIDATGGYTISSPPTVTWVGGVSWDNLDLSANAENVVTFWRIGGKTFAALVTNGAVELEAHYISFSGDGSVLVPILAGETLGLGSATNLEADGTAGTGTLTFEKNGVGASGSTTFVAGDVLKVTLASSTTDTAVAIPRELT